MAIAGVVSRGSWAASSDEPLPAQPDRTASSVGGYSASGSSTVSAPTGGGSGLAADSPSTTSLEASLLGMEVRDLRGLWLVDPVRGRVARLGGDPTPPLSASVPILMYHHVRPIDFRTSDAFTSDLTLPPLELERQLGYLNDRGFRSATLRDLDLHLQGRKALAPRSIVLSFDDGYRDNYLHAYPLLSRYGFVGTFFVITDLVGRDDYATWWQLREMAAAGMEIGSHTVSHPDLAHVSPAQRERELTESKKALEDALGVPIRALSYPSGAFSREVVSTARQAGYSVAVTTQYGTVHERAKQLELGRVRIHGTDTLAVFRWRIEQLYPLSEPPAQ